jgi:hypothetical protein
MCSNISKPKYASDSCDSAHHFEEKQNMIRCYMPVFLNSSHAVFQRGHREKLKKWGTMATAKWARKFHF